LIRFQGRTPKNIPVVGLLLIFLEHRLKRFDVRIADYVNVAAIVKMSAALEY
jgi:hypothetical protein